MAARFAVSAPPPQEPPPAGEPTLAGGVGESPNATGRRGRLGWGQGLLRRGLAKPKPEEEMPTPKEVATSDSAPVPPPAEPEPETERSGTPDEGTPTPSDRLFEPEPETPAATPAEQGAVAEAPLGAQEEETAAPATAPAAPMVEVRPAATVAPAAPKPNKMEILGKIDDLETAIEAKEKEIEAADAKRTAAARAAVLAESQAVAPSLADGGGEAASTRAEVIEIADLVELVYARNAKVVEKSHEALLALLEMGGEVKRDAEPVFPSELPVYAANLAQRATIGAKLLPAVRRRLQEMDSNNAQLRARFYQLHRAWEAATAKREREREKRKQSKYASSSRDDDAAAAGRVTGRNRSIGSFDVVRSEEEMNAVLAQLAEQEKKERNDDWYAAPAARSSEPWSPRVPAPLLPLPHTRDPPAHSFRLLA